MLDEALSYAEHGVYVFPLRPGTKAPITSHGVHDATTDAEQITSWWTQYPAAGIGIACGPSGLLVVDVDSKAGFSFAADASATLALSDTYTVSTPSGGWHFYFLRPDGIAGTTVSKLAEGVDTRGVGGYVVAPPTSGYSVLWDNEVEPLPQHVLENLTKTSSLAETERLDRASILSGVSEGGRDDALFRYACSLRARGVDLTEAQVLVAYAADQCSPPFPASEALTKVERAYDSYDPPYVQPDGTWIEFSFDQLCTSTLPAISWVVADLVPEGTTLLAGPPKLGKSWFVLDLAISVATGRPFLGAPTIAGDVLVLALEDNARRLQGRTKAILGKTPLPPADALRFRTMAPPLGGGLESVINSWACSVPAPRLVVIDTLGRVQGRSADTNGYSSAVGEIGSLQALSTAHNMAIVLVTHTRKVSDTQGADFLESVLGSQGLAGTADSILVLRRKRGEDTGTLYVTGREIKDETPLQIRFDTSSLRWTPRTDTNA